MKHFPRLILPLALLALIASGCGAPPIETAYNVRASFNTAERDLILARPLLDDATFNALAQAKDAALPVLDELDRAAIEAQQSNIPIARAFSFNVALDTARKTIDDFLLSLATSKQAKARKPSTRP
jgi:hypothetical protein